MKNIKFQDFSRRELDTILGSAEVGDTATSAAEAGADHARSIAPVDTGEYRSRFRVEQGPEGPRIVNDDPGAAAIEYGSDDTPAHHVLSQTADWIEGSD